MTQDIQSTREALRGLQEGDALTREESCRILWALGALERVVPRVGSWWIWDPLGEHERVQVTRVRLHRDEVQVTSWGPGGEWTNDLSRWVEATICVQED